MKERKCISDKQNYIMSQKKIDIQNTSDKHHIVHK